MNNIYTRYLAIFFTVAALCILWELALEDIVMGRLIQSFEPETLAGKSAHIIAFLAVCLVSLAVPFRLALKRIAEREKREREREVMIRKLQAAMREIKTLRGIIPICAHCKQIRDEQGAWKNVEEYISERTEGEFTHSICPGCLKENYPEVYEEMAAKR